MVADGAFQPVRERGWRRGFMNLFRKETRAWWGTRRWLVQAVLWTVVVNGLLAFILFGLPPLMAQMDPAQLEEFEPVAQGLQAIGQLGTVALALGAVLLAQDQILGERQRGVTEWILSKPASRTAYILAKLAADGIGVVVILIGLQMALAYGQFWLVNGTPLPLGPFLTGTAGLVLHTLFYLCLTLMMGVLVDGREQLLGVPLGVLFGGLIVVSFLGTFGLFTPWSMAAVLPAVVLEQPMPLPVWVPLVSTAVLAGLCVAVTLWKFKNLEF
jgi:ABC-2 type transport system permease protein